MKKNRTLIALCLALAMVLCLAACGEGGGATATPDKVNDLKINFETGEFSFSDVDAEEYYVRLFLTNPGEEDAEMPITALRVRDREGSTSYTGTVDMSPLEPGTAYNAVVYTYVENDEGELVGAVSDPVTGTYKKAYPTPTNVGGVSCTILDNVITVTLSGDFFAGEYGNKDPGFQVNLLSGGKLVESKTLASDDVEVVITTSTNSSGQEETSVEGKAEVTFTVADPAAAYTVTLKVISTDSTAYYDSAEGEGYAVTEYVEPAPTEPNQGGEGGSEGSEATESTEPAEGGSEGGEGGSEGGEGGSEGGEATGSTEPVEGGSEGGEGGSEGGEG